MLSRAPFVSVTLFFATGIWVGGALLAAFRMPVVSMWALLLFVGLACAVVYYFKLNSWFSRLLACWMVLLGVGCQWWTEAQKDAQRAALNALKYTSYTAEVTTLPEKRAHSVRFEVKARAFQCADHWITHPVRALIYIPDSVTVLPKPGDRILARGVLKQPEPPRNPAQFDYAQYLRNKGILFTAFTASYRLLPVSNASSAAYWPETVSQWADEKFRENLEDSAAYGLVKAMLLGRRDDLQTEQVGDYMISGAVHILSVSGMHVAIIFLAIGTAFGWLRRWRAGKWIYLALMLGLLAFYALVTGLPPSVQRAGLMCAVVVVAEVAGRKQHSMNTLAFSALIILLLDPCALYDVGFQLSYLAMAGIFLLYEPISGIFQPGNRVLKFLWQVTALAFAAQIATFPLSIFYFHQFPTYFWLVNPLVVLFTNILLPAALVLLLFSATPLVGLFGKIVSISAWLTDWSASLPRALPGHLVENLHVNALEVVMLYAIIFLVWLAVEMRSLVWLKYAAASILLFVAVAMAASLQNYVHSERVTFEIPKHRVMTFKRGNVLWLVSDQAFAQDSRAWDYHIQPYAVSREVQRIVSVTAH